MMNKLLSIAIPTYNRCADIKKNLDILCEIIEKNNLCDDVQIVISNNASPDDTDEVINRYVSKEYLTYYRQETNIGGEPNMLFVVDNSKSTYVMLLGDDDFLAEEYLLEVISLLKRNKNVSFIAGNFRLLFPDGSLGIFREKPSPTTHYSKGLFSCWKLASYAHQLSGIVLKREGLVEYYNNLHRKTLYTQIIWAALLTLNGESYHITNNPVLVSHIPQNKKDWSYGKDGLFVDLLACIKRMGESYFVRSWIQCSVLYNLAGPSLGSVYSNSKDRFNFIIIIAKSAETMFSTKLFFVALLILLVVRKVFKSIFKKLKNFNKD